MKKEDETTLYYILVGIFLNGVIQGKSEKELNKDVIEEAIKEIRKLCDKTYK